MSLVAVHAGALAYRTDLSAAETRETAAIIQANSQRALADLREILGLLRDTERGIDVTHHRPQPTLGDLDSLLDDERAAGAHVTLRSDLEDLDALPESIGRSAFRIVQEGLTNARKHAPHAMVTVELTGHPGHGLDLSVRNPVRVGGELNGKHGLTRNGDFVLRAWLPWER
jgi:signal transduction histidine kinase